MHRYTTVPSQTFVLKNRKLHYLEKGAAGFVRISDNFASDSVILSRSIAMRDCNPGMLFQTLDFGIEICQCQDRGIESLILK